MNLMILRSPKINGIQKKKLMDVLSPCKKNENLEAILCKLADNRRMSDSDWLSLK